MIIYDAGGDNAEFNPQLFGDFINGSYETLSTDEAYFTIFDKSTKERERTLSATEVVDCIVIALWGKTREGADFISLVHKSGASSVKDLMHEFIDTLNVTSELSYLVIPGPASKPPTFKMTTEECEKLFGRNNRSTFNPDVTFISYPRKYDKCAVAIRGESDSSPKILVVKPNLGRYKPVF